VDAGRVERAAPLKVSQEQQRAHVEVVVRIGPAGRSVRRRVPSQSESSSVFWDLQQVCPSPLADC
jgi:hypothetical protein